VCSTTTSVPTGVEPERLPTVSRSRTVWINFLVAVCFLFLLEAGSRLVYRVDFPDPLVTTQRDDWSLTRKYDPLLVWKMQPGIERENERLTNSLGLRGPEIPPKTSREFRILSLGESTTFGIRLPYDQTYSARLQQNLGTVNGRPVRVINGGIPGYSLLQGVKYLQYRGLKLEPDAVLVYFGYNDFLPIAFRSRRTAQTHEKSGGMTDSDVFNQRRRVPFRLAHALARRSNFVRILLFSRHGSHTGVTTSPAPRVPESDRRRLLADLKQLATENGLHLVIIAPWYREFEQHLPLLREFSANAGVPLVDLPEELQSLPRPRAEYFFDSVHPNSAGHELIATVIAESLQRLWSGSATDGRNTGVPHHNRGGIRSPIHSSFLHFDKVFIGCEAPAGRRLGALDTTPQLWRGTLVVESPCPCLSRAGPTSGHPWSSGSNELAPSPIDGSEKKNEYDSLQRQMDARQGQRRTTDVAAGTSRGDRARWLPAETISVALERLSLLCKDPPEAGGFGTLHGGASAPTSDPDHRIGSRFRATRPDHLLRYP